MRVSRGSIATLSFSTTFHGGIMSKQCGSGFPQSERGQGVVADLHCERYDTRAVKCERDPAEYTCMGLKRRGKDSRLYTIEML